MNRRAIALALTTALAVAVGVAGVANFVTHRQATGTLVLLASARAPDHLELTDLVVGGTTLHPGRRADVPAAPGTTTVLQATLPAGRYPSIEVNGRTLKVDVQVEAGIVQPLLLTVAASHVTRASAGNSAVNLELAKLSGRVTPLPDFALLDQHAQSFTKRSITGTTTVIAAFHTTCHETCPLYTGLFLELQRELSNQRSPRLVEVTTDPAHDTPGALAAYAASVGARWTFATGDPASLRAFWRTFGVSLSSGDTHSSILAIVDGDGYVRDVYRGVPDVGGSLPGSLVAQLSGQGQSALRSHGDGWGAAQVLDSINQGTVATSSGGRPAPDFVLVGRAGQSVGLDDFRGKPVAISFWASWCAPCRAELPMLQAEAASHGVSLLLVEERDDHGAGARMTSALGVKAAVAYDDQGSVATQYRVTGLPATAFVRADGSLQGIVLGELTRTAAVNHLATLSVGD